MKTFPNRKFDRDEYRLHLETIKSPFIPLEPYQNICKMINHLCSSCNHIWRTTPQKILENPKCKYCRKFNGMQYDQYIALKHSNFVALESYLGISTKIKHLCKTCNEIWVTQPRTVLRGADCRNCFRNRVAKPVKQYHEDLKQKNPEMSLVGEYRNAYTKTLHRHICGYEWQIRPESLLRGSGCPACYIPKAKAHWSKKVTWNGREYASSFEMECARILVAKFGEDDISFQKLYSPERKLSCDFYVKQHDLYIEVSTINKIWYFERIWKKRKLVKNFFFASTLDQLTDRIAFMSEVSIIVTP